MPALATYDDVLFRMPGNLALASNDQHRVLTLLDDATAVVQRYTRRSFTYSQTTETLRPTGQRIKLPNRPVISVDSVSVNVWNTWEPLQGWVFDGIDELDLAGVGSVVNASELVFEWLEYRTPVAAVTYTHGYHDVPQEVAAVVAGMVIRSLTTPGVGGTDRESVGDYSISLSTTSQMGPLALSDAEKSVLNPYRRAVTTAELRGA